MDIEAALQAVGCEIVGPTGRLKTALQLASDETLDAGRDRPRRKNSGCRTAPRARHLVRAGERLW
jgi:hypothetical protein